MPVPSSTDAIQGQEIEESREPKPPEQPIFAAYLMAHFTHEEKLFYAYSRDARNWTVLNGGKPVFDPGVRLRDPFLNRVNGVFHLVHTMAWDNPVIYHWESTDLLHWTGGPITVVYPEQKRAWAPEFFDVAAEEMFYVFWASEYEGHNAIWYTRTKDWTDITPDRSALYYDIGIHDIDIDIVEHNGIYYNFHKPGDVDDKLGNRLSTARSLDPGVDSFARDGIGRDIFPDSEQPTEGPEVVKLIGEDRWYIYTGPFHAEMEAWETTDFETFTKIDVSTPPGSKHCGLVTITDAELEILLAAYS